MPRKLLLGTALFALIVCVILFTPQGRIGVPVSSSLVPPPVVVSLNQTNSPLRVFPGVTGVLIILPDGSLWRWGQTGGALFSRARAPEQVGTNRDWAEAFAANNHCVGLRTNGTIWEWGYRGNNQPCTVPTQVDPNTDWVGIAAGDLHSVALRRDGTLWAWGDNSRCQLGNGPGPNPTNLVQVGTNSDWRAVACGQGSHTLGLRNDGTLWVWGEIFGFTNGQPGFFPAPTQICRETNWVGLGNGPLAEARSGSGLWYPLEYPPDATAGAASICRLISSNVVPHHVASAFCGRPEIYEVRPDGTLWARLNAIGPWAKTRDHHWHRIGKRSDWVSIWGTGAVMGYTSDGTVWTWGSDLGQAPIPVLPSSFRLLLARVQAWCFGLNPANATTVATWPYQRDPRPLMR